MRAAKVVQIVAAVMVILLISSALSGATSAAPPPGTKYIVFEGHVKNQRSGGPLVGVTIELHMSAWIRSSQWVLADTTQTDTSGAFRFRRQYASSTIYTVREKNPLFYRSTGVVAPGARVIDNDTVEYANPGAGTYDGIVFWDRFDYVTFPTPTPTPVTTDFVITDLEVTQAVQDLDNNVPLIRGKRTYVRVHVKANDGNHSGVLGEFQFASKAGETIWIKAGNSGGRIKVREYPGRGFRDHSFFVEVPPNMLGGNTFTIYFRMNYDKAVPEVNHANNWTSETHSLIQSPPLRIKIYNVQYEDGGAWHAARFKDIIMLVSWLQRAYPVPSVNWHVSTLYWPFDDPPGATSGDCGRVNSLLWSEWVLDGQPNRRYYGMVTDTGSWMRGCAAGIPAMMASGPTGTGAWGWNAWDTDGSYGDFYGAHELGHCYGRAHTACSGSEGGPDPAYPYPGGWIGAPLDGRTAYGWDVELRQVYPPFWTDIMTYCPYEWISDWTYKAIRNRLVAEAAAPAMAAIARQPRVAVSGSANTEKGTATLGTLRLFTDAVAADPPRPSDEWKISLYSQKGSLLASHSFTPRTDRGVGEEGDPLAAIQEILPWDEGTARIDVEYRGRQVASKPVSFNAPTVTVTQPNGGEVLSGDTATARWDATDADGDKLSYAIQYSPDAGVTWETVAVELPGNEHEVALSTLPGSKSALFRVIASDGVRSGQDESDAVFEVTGKPPRAIVLSPKLHTSYSTGQQVVLAGEGYDVEDGVLGDEALSWSSDLQGDLGTGRLLALTNLGAGTHTITLRATDIDKATGSDTTVLFVDVPLEIVSLPAVTKP